MRLESFGKNHIAEISIHEDEIRLLSNVLYHYFNLEDANKDKELAELRAQLYIIYEILHHGAVFDSSTMKFIQDTRESYDA